MNNTHQAGFFRPVRDFVPAVHTISMEVFNKLCSELEKNQRITDMLIPFYRSVNVTVVQTTIKSYAPYPKDYGYHSSVKLLLQNETPCADAKCELWNGKQFLTPEEMKDFFPVSVEYVEQKITKVPDSKFSAASQHPTRKPSMSNPICTQTELGLQLMPKDIGVVLWNYYREPKPPVFNYTLLQDGVDDYFQYNAAGSEQLEWDEILRPVFLYKLLLHYGLFVDDRLKIEVSQISKELL